RDFVSCGWLSCTIGGILDRRIRVFHEIAPFSAGGIMTCRFLLAAVCVATAGAGAMGDVVVYRNSGPGFQWQRREVGVVCPGSMTDNYLDVTLPSSQGGNTQTVTTVYYLACYSGGSRDCQPDEFRNDMGSVEFARNMTSVPTMNCNPGENEFFPVRMFHP